MNTLLTIITFIGVFIAYHTSQKATLQQPRPLGIWLQRYTRVSKRFAVLVLFVAFLLAIYMHGLAAGILLESIQLMSLTGLLVLIAPLHVVDYRHLLLLFPVLFGLENWIG